MMLMSKVKKTAVHILEQRKNDKRFSRTLANARMMSTFTRRFSRTISEKYNNQKNQIILNCIIDIFKDILERHRDDDYTGFYDEHAPIWVCWWTGVDNAPALVKQCVKSIKKNSNGHPIYIITEKNYMNYLDIPSYILDKVNKGIMCLANFSDYLRISLLEKYGGMWLDATVYVSQSLPEDMFERELFTCKSPGAQGFFANGRWTSYCIGGWKKNTFFIIVKECFERYWERYDMAIDYLLVDYIFASVYDNNPYCKQVLDDIPITNLERNMLSYAMVTGMPAEDFNKYIKDSTTIYKLSWREKYPEKTKDGKDSVYSLYLNMDLE